MDRQTFTHEMVKAKTFINLSQDPDYWYGYQRGLRRQFYGDTFGSEEDHSQWLSLANSDDDIRRKRGRGYHAGFNFPDS